MCTNLNQHLATSNVNTDMAFSVGSRSCIESLKSDLRSTQSGLKEVLLACTKREGLQVPSWRFSEKLAASLDTDEMLRDLVYSNGSEQMNYSTHVQLLELVVDRLVLLLQCCLRFSDENLGHKSATLPLTIGSATKKFAKRFLHDMCSSLDLKKQVCAKDEKIASLQSTATNLQEECKLLQETLHNCIPQDSINSNAGRPGTTSSILTVPSRPTSSCIPYEAEGTLRINRLTMATRSLSSLRNEGAGDFSNGRKSNPTTGLVTSTPIGEEPDSTTQSSSSEYVCSKAAPVGMNASTQTTETAFALCARCSETQDSLVSIAASVSGICSKHHLGSALADTDWRALARVGGLELKHWEGALGEDLSSIGDYCCQLENRADQLASESSMHREATARIELESKSLSSQIHSLQSAIHEIQEKNECTLSESRETFATHLKQLEDANRTEELRNARLREELNGTQKQVTHLTTLMAQLERHRGCLQSELQMVQGQELQLLSVRQGLEEELSCVRGELIGCKDQLDVRGVELNKTRVHNQTLEKRVKSLQGKHSRVLKRLDELDQECSNLHEELLGAVTSRDKLEAEMERIQNECTQLQGRLLEEETKVSQLNMEQARLVQQASELEQQVSEVRHQLQEERHKCRLLMDYPFAKQTTGGVLHQKQISANTVRILLLEEQNADLRDRIAQAAKAMRLQTKDMFQLKGPTPLWQNQTLSKAQTPADQAHNHPQSPTEKSEKRQTESPVADKYPKRSPPAIDSGQSVTTSSSRASLHKQKQLQKSSKLRGRLGHLVEAIAEAHRLSPSPPPVPMQRPAWYQSATEASNHSSHDSANSSYSDIEISLCNKCDRMFHSKVEFDAHQLICNNYM